MEITEREQLLNYIPSFHQILEGCKAGGKTIRRAGAGQVGKPRIGLSCPELSGLLLSCPPGGGFDQSLSRKISGQKSKRE
ncbi:hypothetical protein [Aquiflexum sp.]|uniref:hypothetical protein n=1 Tax=Aquiflexum sp. TaxID=1872584 RepID=UPI003594254D